MTNEEMADLFMQSYEEGYTTRLLVAECSSACDYCPAVHACEQLAEDSTYKTFVKNYKDKIVPILIDRGVE